MMAPPAENAPDVPKKGILFVDDEIKVLQGLQRMLHSMRHVWRIETAESGEKALALLDQSEFDVIITDMRMPGMDGAQLLDVVMRKFPHMVRIILSGQTDQDAVMRSVGSTHQYLAKPCTAETLKQVVVRACKLQNELKNPSLRKLISRIQTLPSLPSLYAEIMGELGSSEPSLERIAWIISRDVGMTAKLLQLVNSSFFGFYSNVTDPARALNILGLDKVRSLVLTIHIFSQLQPSPSGQFDLNGLWNHGLRVANLSRNIACLQDSDQVTEEEAFMAGLLHDTGKLIMMTNLPDLYRQALALAAEKSLAGDAAEREIFGASHAEVGAYLFGLWGFSNPMVAAIAFHHNPCQAEDAKFTPLTAVHVANALVAGASVDHSYLWALGLFQSLPAWQKLHEQSASEG